MPQRPMVLGQPSLPYAMTTQERNNLRSLADYTTLQSLPELWPLAAQRFAQVVAVQDPYAQVTLTYPQLHQQIQQFACGLQALGVQSGERVALFADNSARWLIADQGMMMAGAVNVVRSAQAEYSELLFILANSGSTALAVEDHATLYRLRDGLLALKFVVLLSDETPPDIGLNVLNFTQLMNLGCEQPLHPVAQDQETLATLIYTSGTTGQPKGVRLTHGNLLHQVTSFGTVLQPKPGSRVLSILPTWHSYERSVEYFLFSQGCTQVYTNLRAIKKDLRHYRPQFMVAVPRLWESIYAGVQKQFREQPPRKQRLIYTLLALSERFIRARRLVQGLDLKNLQPTVLQKVQAVLQTLALGPIHALADRLVYRSVREATGGAICHVVSGGGSLAEHLELFFEIVSIEILVGYGLTETAPVLTVRRPWRNLRGTAGQPLPGTELQIVDLQTRQRLPYGSQGLVLARGPQVMRGYYQNPGATATILDAEGWLDTGDLGWLTPEQDLVLTGRAKDTIVLTNGENIEPQPLEDACLRSPFIDQIMVVGQDQRALGALIVPNLEALQTWAKTQDLTSPSVRDLLRRELNREVQNRPGYRPDDRIGPLRLLPEPFTQENGLLTQTLKVRRSVVAERYRDLIAQMFTES
ncbi:AMP-dependent synthetase/ligase [Anthocerotibacter panamensis]|uniref:AMP-dependent synthetase/ligase n=1 Tax=Anthocerotibacter panamensis TaxID=2857077 RepID=UPI001C404352|nr:AMP-binding protein [Anthocerotibacter panamensis]